MSNSGIRGGRASYASTEKQMEAFDRLPRSVRAALSNATFNWAAYPIRGWFEAGRYTAKDLVKKISAWDQRQIAKDQKRVWGIEAPKRRGRRSS
jgi:hypothetical protein